MTVSWGNKQDQELFEGIGVSTFDDFMEIEKKELPIDIKVMRQHKDKKSGLVNRSMIRVIVKNEIFYLKRTSGKAFINISNEYDAIQILPKFNLVPPEIAAYKLDQESSSGFILLKDLKGYYSIKELLTGKASESAIKDFNERIEDILKSVADKIESVHSANYAFPDWFGKHLYIKEKSDDIVLIDLERFRPLSKSPWYFGFPIVSIFIKRKFWRKLRNSLLEDGMDSMLVNKFLHG